MAGESRKAESPDDPEAPAKRHMVIVWLLAASALLFICQVIGVGAPLAKAQAIKTLPASIRAQSAADYSADAKTGEVPQVNKSIFFDLIMDVPATIQVGDRLGTLEAGLQTPVPTMTPNGLVISAPSSTRTLIITEIPTGTVTKTQTTTDTARSLPTAIGSPTFTSTYTLTRTGTGTYTTTVTQTSTATATKTPSRTSTNTGTITSSPTRTNTRTPTSPASPTQTYTPTFTDTSIPGPTDTFTPTNTDTFTATDTPITLPTNTFTFTPTPTDTSVFSPTSTISGGCVEYPSGGFIASQDTWVDKTKPDVSYGGDSTIIIRPTAGVDQRGLIAFDLGSIPAGSTIHSAYLYLTITTGKTYTVEFYPATESWDESTTWNTMPGYDASSKGSLSLSSTACTRVAVFDATLVQGWVDGTVLNFGIYLFPPAGSGQSIFSSREGASPPVLVVDYSMP